MHISNHFLVKLWELPSFPYTIIRKIGKNSPGFIKETLWNHMFYRNDVFFFFFPEALWYIYTNTYINNVNEILTLTKLDEHTITINPSSSLTSQWIFHRLTLQLRLIKKKNTMFMNYILRKQKEEGESLETIELRSPLVIRLNCLNEVSFSFLKW